ncbi:Protein N-acetyltransferase, RimJ/RimL family [Blastococcus aggregatus]|uniref:Protein N-acetyltransferase, RimJ/RimL family n=1 Tax=Blastococcus aggregatus TaxID=38502 RepID=A0A285V4A0_9ACTN|nr:GNAT family protein [Blastococcus aggregatus]SOC48890.1 Protein N-acetyltransferase, RimJ/RimL family [Blastococcus aggregatus]
MDLTLIDLPTEVVRTERLVLRPYRADDVAAVHRACQDADIQRWLRVPSPYTETDAAEFVTETSVSARAEGRGLLTAVEADGEFVGSAGLHLTPGHLGPAVGYWLAPWGRGRGFAAEAAHALAEWALGLGAPRVHLMADVGNTASQAVAVRAGFTREGVVRSCLDYRDGSRGDAVLFGRLPED